MVKNKAFTLIELLVAVIIVGILSSFGLVGYNSYIENSNDLATKNNYQTINKISEAEFAKCKLNNDYKIFDNHSCKNSSPPTVTQLDNYFTNTQKLKNPYNQNDKVVQNDICVPGGVTINTTSTGAYETAYFSKKNNTKNTSIINSTWSQKFQEASSASVAFSCIQTTGTSTPISTSPSGSFSTYSVPANCPSKNCLGAYIKVDVNGKMTGDYDGGAVMEKDVAQSWSNSSYKWVLVNPADASGNVYSACAGRACSYNFSNNTYTVNQVIYDPLTGKPK